MAIKPYNIRIFKPGQGQIRPCYLVSLCVCFNMFLQDAINTGITSDMNNIVKTVKKLDGNWYTIPNKITLNQFIDEHPVGIYYIVLTRSEKSEHKFNHAIALVDSIIYDANTTVDYNDFYIGGYSIISPTTASYDTSFLDTPEIFKKYVKEYFQTVYGLNKIKIKHGTNISAEYSDTLFIKVGKDQFFIEFPLNSNEQANKQIIQDTIDRHMKQLDNIEEAFKNFDPKYKDYNNCYLIALCACFNIDYEQAKATGIRSDLNTINRVLTRLHCDYSESNEQLSLDDFCKQYKTGIYYVVMQPKNAVGAGHAVAVIDGDVYDSEERHPDYSQFVIQGYFEVKKNRANYDTSWVDNPEYFKDFILQYTQNKLGVANFEGEAKVSLQELGSNQVEVDINNKKVTIDFPLDATQATNEKLIQKAVDRII